MVTDVDRRRDDELLSGVEAVPRHPAVLVADEVAALGIAGVVAKAPLLEPEAVGQGVMSAHVLDEHRVDPRRLVEVPAGRQAPVAEHLRVHADGADPLAVRRPLGGLGDPADEVRDRRDARVANVDRGELRAGEGQVVMGVDEAGQDRPARRVDLQAVRRGGGEDGVVVADGDDPVADDRDAAREGSPRRSGREHPPVHEHQPAHRVHLALARVRIASIVPASAADYDAPVLMEGSPRHPGGGPALPTRRTEHASLDHDRRALRGRHTRRRLFGRRWCDGDARGIGARRVGPGRVRPRKRAGERGRQRRGQRRADSAACNPPRQDGVTLSFTSFGGRLPGGPAQGMARAVHGAHRRAVHRGRELVRTRRSRRRSSRAR